MARNKNFQPIKEIAMKIDQNLDAATAPAAAPAETNAEAEIKTEATPGQKKQNVAIVTIVTKAPRGYRPQQSVSRWVVVSDWPKPIMRAAIDWKCREMAEDLEKETGTRFKVSWTVAYVAGLIGVSYLGAKASAAAVPQPSEEE